MDAGLRVARVARNLRATRDRGDRLRGMSCHHWLVLSLSVCVGCAGAASASANRDASAGSPVQIVSSDDAHPASPPARSAEAAPAGSSAAVVEVPVQGEPAQAVAMAWFNALIAGDVPKALALSSVPFSFDKRKLIATRQELEAQFQTVADTKGERPVPRSTITAEHDGSRVASKYSGAETNLQAFRIVIEDERVLVFVRPSQPPTVVGFSD